MLGGVWSDPAARLTSQAGGTTSALSNRTCGIFVVAGAPGLRAQGAGL